MKEKDDLASTGEPPVEVSAFIPVPTSDDPISSFGNISTSGSENALAISL